MRNVLKAIVLAAAVLSAAPANAQPVVIDLNRMNVITEAAKSICRAGLEKSGGPVEIVDRESSYLKLNQAERLYLYSLCVLYAQGQTDAR